MAKQRYVNTHFWDDKYIIELDPIEKLLFIYCLTNPLTSIVGAYEISLRRISFDTGIERDMVQKILARFEAAGKVFYREGWIVIANFIKHQSLNPKIVSGIRNELSKLPADLVTLVNFEYEPKEKTIRKKIPISLRKRILERDGNKCQFCDSTENLEIDHIKPIILGGDDSEANLRALCQPCNGKRNAELRWTNSGEVESKNSLPTEMGGLSHLNSNSNTNEDANAPAAPEPTELNTKTQERLNQLQSKYPKLDVRKVREKYLKHCRDTGKEPTWQMFEKYWLENEFEPMEVEQSNSPPKQIKSQEEKQRLYEQQTKGKAITI